MVVMVIMLMLMLMLILMVGRMVLLDTLSILY